MRSTNAIQPTSLEGSHLYVEQRWRQAELRLRAGDPAEQELGARLIDSLPDTDTSTISLRQAPDPIGRSYQTRYLYEFSALDYKISALVEGAKLLGNHRQRWLDEAYQLSGRLNIDPPKEGYWAVQERVFHQLRLMEELSEDVRPEEVAALQKKWAALCKLPQNILKQRIAEEEGKAISGSSKVC